MSTFANWGALGSAYESRAAAKATATPSIRKLAEELTKGATDQRDEVRKIYEWAIRNVRYVALHLGTGPLVPRAAETIIDTKYGDCKDYTTLMQACLQPEALIPVLCLSILPTRLSNRREWPRLARLTT
ncbi:MAG: transglutaminase domain-containing protein [Betaproteobacteria bacterium]|nr:transglutaminase domain-containing protein [Betaproteobacteria bacterium]